MSTVTKIDIGIIGGGSAGITLASKLSAHQLNKHTVVFEPKTPEQRECCWSLWATSEQREQFKHAILGSWKKWRLIDESKEVLLKSNDYQYTCLSSAKYLRHNEESLAGKVSLQRTSVDNLTFSSESHRFDVAGNQYCAKEVFDSRPSPVVEGSLQQHFLGWEIRTKHPILHADTATLMDFRVDQSKGLHFIYALPFSSNHLFIESTMISNKIEAKEWYRDAITEWLTREGIEVREKLREEVGVIPMQEPQKNISRAPTIGGASGAVRLSSGYAFSAIQTQMTRLTEGIVKGNYKVPAATSSHLNFMDRVFNDVLISNPRLGVDLFMRTAGALKGDQFAHYMLGSASLTGWLKVISAMPKWPFIKAVWRQVLSHD